MNETPQNTLYVYPYTRMQKVFPVTTHKWMQRLIYPIYGLAAIVIVKANSIVPQPHKHKKLLHDGYDFSPAQVNIGLELVKLC